jgi:N-acetylneuraminic acid mutarotase
MKSLLFLSMLLAVLSSATAQTVTQSADLPAPGRFGAVAFTIDDIAYTGLGETGSEQYPKQFYKYDSETDTWTEIAAFPGTGREFAVAFVVGGLGYVGLGFSFAGVDFTYHKDFFRYDPVTDSWDAVADFEGVGRVKAVAFALDSTAYAGSGSNAGTMLDDFWKYDFHANVWTAVNTMNTVDPLHGAVATTVDDKAYLIGGRGIAGVYSEHILEFDPALGESWVIKKTVPGLTLEDGAAFALDHQVYFGYGGNSSTLRKFDPITHVVSDFGPLPDLKSIDRGPVAFSIDSTKAYFGLGYSSVVANQPASYRKQFWKLEVEIISSVSPVRLLSGPKIIATANGSFQLSGEEAGPYSVAVHTLDGIQIAFLPAVSTFEDFAVSAPVGLYVFSLRNVQGAMQSELIFNKSE